MKRYIASSAQTNPFELNTHVSYYNNFLDDEDLNYMQNAKNLTGEIVYMSPEEYFSECASKIFDDTSVASLKAQRAANSKLIERYKSDMIKGDKFPLCYINYTDKQQEGLHRMMAAGDAFGWDRKYPVLIVTIYDQARWDRKLKQDKINDFQQYDLAEICDEAAGNIANAAKPVPDNIIELYKSEIETIAKSNGNDIEVDVEISEHEDGDIIEHRLDCYLVKYDGTENTYLYNRSNAWLEDMFNTGSEDSLDDDSWIDDLDIDNLSLEDLARYDF